jgi:predicted nucleic acid-binding protein
MYYLDASLVVTFLTNEPDTDKVSDWLSGYVDGTLFISPWVITEVASALSIKERRGDLTTEMRAAARGAFALLCDQNLESKAMLDSHFESAARFCDQVALGLRAGDALHLAIASHYGLTLVTRDTRLAEAGPLLGAATLLL